MSGVIRILHLEPDLEIGGGQEWLLRMIPALNALVLANGSGGVGAGFEHIVCAVTAGGALEEQFRAAGIETIVLNAAGLVDIISGVLRLCRFCLERRISLIHTNNTLSDSLYGQLAALICRLPVVNTLHSEPRGARADQHQIARQRFFAALKLLFRNWLMRRTTRHFVAVSERVRVAWRPYLRRLGKFDQITVLPPGLNVSRFQSDPAEVRTLRAATVGDNAWPVLIDVARLVNGKGLEHLPKMMKAVAARYPGAKLVLAGEGSLRPAIEAAIQANGVTNSIVLLGQRQDVPMLLQASDLFVFPSAHEGFGLAVLEAMAAGKPVVAFALPSLMEFVEPPSGLLLPLEDEAALIEAVIDLLGEPERMMEMGQQGRRIVEERFRNSDRAERMAEIYHKVLHSEIVRRRRSIFSRWRRARNTGVDPSYPCG
jgi:glycosyltransferase involved in cell wall biosynthesis